MVTYRKEDNFGIVEFNDVDSKVNLLSDANLDMLRQIIEGIENDNDLKALFFVSKKPDIFIVGADIKELITIDTKEKALDKCKKTQGLFNRIEHLRIPTFSILNGACVGGGLELALSCKVILATNNKHVLLGMPEVKLGITAGFGGTYRLPRKIGHKNANKLISTGRLININQAQKIKLIDRVIPESEQFSYEKHLVALRRMPFGHLRGETKPKLSYGNSKFDARCSMLDYPLRVSSIEYREKQANLLRDALKIEREVLAEKIVKPEAKNSMAMFLLARKYKDYPWVEPRCPKPLNIERCSIIGAGVMGRGIAYLVSSRDVITDIRDVNKDTLKKARINIKNIYTEAVKKGIWCAYEAKSKFKYLSFGKNLKAATIVIEAIEEDILAKKELLAGLEKEVKKGCILASNTSSVPLEELSKSLKNAENFLGVHFFNPAYKMKLVEVIPTTFTDKSILDATVEFLRRLKRFPIVVKDRCGFLVNRMLLPYLNEAIFMLEEGFSPKDIDGAMVKFGMPMGPQELLNQIGPDTAYKVSKILYDNFGDRMKVPNLLYKNSININCSCRDEACLVSTNLLKGKREGAGYILERLLSPMRREAELCLEEGVVGSREVIDLALFLGIGFPASKRIWKR